jgi:hypothetical protein
MTKPTGRPRGRPKTKEYVTLMARVDVALADRVKRYARLHRQPLSVVLRDALTLLMDEYPSGADLRAPHRVAEHEFLSDRYESPLDTLVGETDSAGLADLLSDTNNFAIETIMSDMNRGLGYLSDTNENNGILSDANRDKEILSDAKPAPADIAPDRNTGAEGQLLSTPELVFDATKHILGKLCPRLHDYEGTGQSVLRRTNRHCILCDREKFRERQQAKRQAQGG